MTAAGVVDIDSSGGCDGRRLETASSVGFEAIGPRAGDWSRPLARHPPPCPHCPRSASPDALKAIEVGAPRPPQIRDAMTAEKLKSTNVNVCCCGFAVQTNRGHGLACDQIPCLGRGPSSAHAASSPTSSAPVSCRAKRSGREVVWRPRTFHAAISLGAVRGQISAGCAGILSRGAASERIFQVTLSTRPSTEQGSLETASKHGANRAAMQIRLRSCIATSFRRAFAKS